MKILSCITDPVEISYLRKVGADEVYFAVSWLPNYANSGSIRNFDDLKRIIRICNKIGMKYHLAINDFRSIIEKKDYVLLKKTINCGIDSIIITDIGLGRYIKDNFKNISIHASSLISVMNIATIEFLYKYFGKNFKRLIIPNHISSKDAIPVINFCKYKNIDTEVFFFRYFGCTYLNGYCYLHGDRYFDADFSLEGSICKFGCGGFKAKIKSLYKIDNKKIISRIDERLNCGKVPRILNASSFFDYYLLGVNFVKYGSRTDPTKIKIEKVRYIRKILDILSSFLIKYDKNEAKIKFIEMVNRI
ncbi:MAG: U32 family peptidase [Elusimicrobiales bacterium]|nr:U32 family peptidase [Elusimicrobiales bacterium]